MEILRVEHLSKSYGKGNTEVRALDDVSFSVQKGDFVAIVGPSGSGKSTLLHLLGGVDRPTSGRVLIDGTDIYQLNPTQLAIFRRRQIGLIYQFYNLIPVLNVEENRRGHLPNQLSGGQQQRVSIGRALINHPALVLADEPTGNLDSQNSAEIIGLLREYNRQHHHTLIVITHDERIALQADRIISVEDGRFSRDEVVSR